MKPANVLVLSDITESSTILADAFQQHGFEIVHARSFEEISAQAATLLIVIDLLPSVAESLHVCRQLRGASATPILIVLPTASSADMLAAYQAGATECIIRPASPAVILLKALAWSMRGGWIAQTQLDRSLPNLAQLLVAV